MFIKIFANSGLKRLIWKILIPLIATLAIGLCAMDYVIQQKGAQITKDLSTDKRRAVANAIVADITGEINSIFPILNTMRDAYLALHAHNIADRTTYLEVLQQVARNNPGFLDAWSVWEPNALDGHDAQFVNTTASDATGRFIPIVTWDPTTSKYTFSANVDYEKPGAGDYYLLARQSLKPQIIEPYHYSLNGQDVLMVSFVVPIIADGKFLGVVGLDLNLAGWSAHLAAIKPFETGSVQLISNGGLWAVQGNTDWLGKPIKDTSPELASHLDDIKQGKGFEILASSPDGKANFLRLFAPIKATGVDIPWSVLVNLPMDKILAPTADLNRFSNISSIVLALVLAMITWAVLQVIISKPLQRITQAMSTLAEGNKTIEVPGMKRGDEMGAMAKAVDIFKKNMLEADQLRADQEAAKQRAENDRREAMLTLANRFESSVGGIVNAVSSAADLLQTTSQSLSATAEQTTRQSTAVVDASKKMTQNVETVAAATEELSTSIREIGNHVTESTRIVGGAVDQANDTNAKVKGLFEAAQKIGAVVTLINEIASQTNLLALNATIEAARAGEAGKGFAVVASEVKNLATQTARATDEIAGQIKAIQDSTDASAEAIQSITQAINRVHEISTTIAAAVEEQGAATQEISRNVQQAAAGTAGVSSNISNVTEASEQTSTESTQVHSAAKELARNGALLKQQVAEFLREVRAA